MAARAAESTIVIKKKSKARRAVGKKFKKRPNERLSKNLSEAQ